MAENQFSINKLTLKEKIAQLFVVGFHGNDAKSGSEIALTIIENKPGGVILFDKDMVFNKPVHNIKSPEQVRELTEQLQNLSHIPLLIGIDQEGGIVNRLKPDYGFPKTRSHQTLGEIDDLDETLKEGKLIAKTLSSVGINTNFAPCVDLALNPKSSIISKKERCFGQTAKHVTKHAEAYINGHEEFKIITACKHFPGHGSAEGDTHAGFVNVTDTWNSEEIEPYAELMDKDLCPLIMSSHIFNGNFDNEYPATLSHKTIQKVLRDEMGYDGVVISDDMQMKAISAHYGLKESLKLGILAGIDLFCFGQNLLKEQIDLAESIQLVEEMVNNNEIPEARIDESVNRILRLKKNYLS